MTVRNQELTALDQRLSKDYRVILFDDLSAFALSSLSLILCYFLSRGKIIGSSFSRLFFRPSGNVSKNTVDSNSI